MRGDMPLREIGSASARGAAPSRHRRYVAVGAIATRARPAALLAALHELRPQCEVRLLRFGAHEPASLPRYHVEVRPAGELAPAGSIALWLRIKSALMTAFPAGRRDAVVPIAGHADR